jgi:hypothetical protein
MAVITIDLPEEIYATLRRSPRELERDVRLAAAIDSILRAARASMKSALGRPATSAPLPWEIKPAGTNRRRSISTPWSGT